MEEVIAKDNQKNDKTRDSQFELLRIICMILIILHHYSVHGGFDKFGFNNLSKNGVIIQILSLWGSLACNIFIMITGYYMIKSKIKYKKIILLLAEMTFYSLGISLIIYINELMKNTTTLAEFPIIMFIKSCIPLIYGNWFTIFYIIIYFLSPYLNKLILALNKKETQKLIITSTILISVIPSIFFDSIWHRFSSLGIMIVSYFIGAYVRLYLNEEKKTIYTILMVACNVLLICSVIVIDILGVRFKSDTLINNATYFKGSSNIISFIVAISIFLYFRNNVKLKSKTVNFIASSVLGVYLIHDNDYIRPILWKSFYPNLDFFNSKYFLIHILVKTGGIFVVCVIIDKIRIYLLEKRFSKLLDKLEHN